MSEVSRIGKSAMFGGHTKIVSQVHLVMLIPEVRVFSPALGWWGRIFVGNVGGDELGDVTCVMKANVIQVKSKMDLLSPYNPYLINYN